MSSMPFALNPVLHEPHIQDGYAFEATSDLFVRVGHNVGNLVFAYALERQLAPSRRMVWCSQSSPLTRGEVVVLACANALRTGYDMRLAVQDVRSYDAPVVAIGLGAQAEIDLTTPQLSPSTLDWVSAIVEKAPTPGVPNVAVQGEFTKQVMETSGFKNACVPCGCPSFYINPVNDLGHDIASRIRIPRKVAVAGAPRNTRAVIRAEQALACVVEETNGSYILQSDLGLVCLGRNEIDSLSDAEFRAFWCNILPGRSKEDAEEWVFRYAITFFDVDSWAEYLKHFDFVIGARIHCVILALQVGIPAICIAFDSRILEMCQLMHIPYMLPEQVPSDISPKIMYELFKDRFNAEDFDNNRKMLAKRYEDFLCANHLRPMRANEHILFI